MACAEIEDILFKFNSLTQKPVKFLTVQENAKEDIKNLVKSLYDFTKGQENSEKQVKKGALPELIVKDFDEEQIWQEIELQNSACWDDLVWEVANCMSGKNTLQFPIEVSKDEESEKQSEDENSLSDDENSEDNESKNKINKKPKTKIKSSIVDDKFFKLQEMEKFLLNEERKGNKKPNSESDSESIDMFEDADSADDEDKMMYNDFFDAHDGHEESELEFENDESEDEEEEQKDQLEPKKTDKKVKFADESSDDDDSESDDSEKNTNELNKKPNKEEKKSDFELRQQRLQQHITRLEEKTLKESPWQLKGEVDATKRPQNSLLQEVVDFDLTTRPPPIITEQTTITLEGLIRQRIKDKAWDDVVKKEKPVDDQLQFRKPEILDHSKSKLSLAQVYEAEYLKQKQALSGEVEEKEPESHTEIREAMSKLFSKLDALSHYHYTPKAPQAEVKIVSNTPAISMEEVAPIATSDAALLAPEEVKRKRRGELMSKEERTDTDKKRERRKKKKLQKNNLNKKAKVEASSLIKSSKNKRNVKGKGQ